MEAHCDMIGKVVRPCRRQQVPAVNRHKATRLPRKEFSELHFEPFCLGRRGFLYTILKLLSAKKSIRRKKMAKIELKKPVVEEISASIKDAQSVVLVDYRGLTVEQDTQLRKQLREAGVTYKVYKNTMMNFAFKGTDCEALIPYLEGPSAMALSTTDATAPARVINNFAKTAPVLEIKGGIVEGIAYDAKGIGEIANIPSREVLLSRLLGSMQSPITNFARVIKQIAEKDGADTAEQAADGASAGEAEQTPAE